MLPLHWRRAKTDERMILPIFPEGGLTSSVVTTVWIGVFVIVYFNLRFGWVLSGLVVPGYIVPLVILRPVAAGVIVLEAILTYLLVWFFSEKFSRGRYSALFGRDRFLALVLASVAVRVTLDGWLLPLAADWLSANFNRQFDWQSNLQSFGLVVVSLMANQFWKPGLVRGVLSFVVITFICWFIVRYGLMEFTNFRLSGVTYVYEGLASSILASPKAYIILIITAIIASQMNLRYGWDFSGILIPALMALQWYQPTKILSSFVEAAIIYFITRLILKLPFLAGMTIEGGRKLVLFFNVSFAYKLVLGHILVWLALDVKTTDFYGFGYLLSTLLAIKAHDKDIFPRLMRSTLEVSLIGAVLGNVAGFLLAWLLPAKLTAASPSTELGRQSGDVQQRQFVEAVGDIWARKAGGPQPEFDAETANAVGDAIELLESGAEPQFIAPALRENGLVLSRSDNGMIAIAKSKGPGRDLILFNPAAPKNLAVILEDAAAMPGIAVAGVAVFKAQNARWLVLTGPSGVNSVAQQDMLTLFRSAAKASELRIVAGSASNLMLQGESAALLDLAVLRETFSGLETRFSTSGLENANAATLTIDSAAIAQLVDNSAPQAELQPCAIEARTPTIRPRPDLPELSYWRSEIAEPLATALVEKKGLPGSAVQAAFLAGLSLDQCILAGKPNWRLSSKTGSYGTMLFNPAADSARLVQSSGSHADILSAAQASYSAWNAGSMQIAIDDKQLSRGQRNLFGVISQAIIRATGNARGGILQFRPAFLTAPMFPTNPNIVVTPDHVERRSIWADELSRLAEKSGSSAVIANRQNGAAGYEIAPNNGLRYLDQNAGKRYATFWVTSAGKKAAQP
jgi:Capsule biosynthesis CapC